MNYKIAKVKYREHCKRCKEGKTDAAGRPVKMLLNFEEWCDIWVDSGKWAKRGNKRGQYCMCRKDDLGHYEVGNVYIDLHSTNISTADRSGWSHTDEAKARISEALRKRIRTDETRAKLSKANTGKKTSDATKAKLSLLNKGRPMNRIKCEGCGMETSPQNLSRHKKVCDA